MAEESGFQVGRDATHFYETEVVRFMEPFVGALVEAVVRPGDSVLDVACGTGFATRAAAAVAGSSARVEGSDLNDAMVAQARKIPDHSGAELEWLVASALDLPYDDDEFDAVLCQQGLQFFPDPVAGLREMARVTRTGGRLGVTVWAPPEQSPFLHRETEMLALHGGGDQPLFSATEQQLSDWFETANLDGVAVELLSVEIDLPEISIYVPAHLRALPWSAGFFSLSEQEQAEALERLDADLAQYRTPDGIRVPFSSHLVTATT